MERFMNSVCLRLLRVRVFGAHRDIGVRAVLTEHAFQKEGFVRYRRSLAESYDIETSDGFKTDCDFVLRSFEWRFVKGLMAHGTGPQLD